MDIDLILTIAIGAITLLILTMRTNVSLAIMGLCAGYVFSDLLSDEIVSVVASVVSSSVTIPIVSAVSIVLILSPALLILRRFKAHQSGRLIQHIIPAVGFALLSLLLIFSNLPIEAVRYLRESSVVYEQFQLFEVLIAVAVVGIAVVDVVLHDAGHRRKYKKKHK